MMKLYDDLDGLRERQSKLNEARRAVFGRLRALATDDDRHPLDTILDALKVEQVTEQHVQECQEQVAILQESLRQIAQLRANAMNRHNEGVSDGK